MTLAAGERLVVDASVAFKWVVAESGSREAEILLDHQLVAPDLLFAECANILWKKVQRGELSAREASLAGRSHHRRDRGGRSRLQQILVALSECG